jgi:tetraacyldisaccharide 4'-kinase
VPLDEPAWWYGDDRTGSKSWGMARWLAPVAAVTGWAAAIRYRLVTPYRARLPVICVGNFTAGGTGKTPLAAHVCDQLRRAGHRPAVLTRGYGGRHAGPHWVGGSDSARDVGDEALLLARTTPTLVARDRSAGARAIESKPEAATVIVMDDGLQNPQLAKDLAIAVVDGARGLGNGRVMPAGPLRASLAFQLGLVDAIVVNAALPGAGDGVAQSLRQRFGGPLLRATTVAAGDASWLRGKQVVAWAGIGAPQRFLAMLEGLGAETVETVVFRDHQPLVAADAERLLGLARDTRAQLVSTEKDLARLRGATGPLAELAAATRVLPIELRFAEPDARRLDALVAAALERSARPRPPSPLRGEDGTPRT